MKLARMMPLVLALAISSVVAPCVRASSPPPKGDVDFGMSGTIGHYPIAMVMTVHDYVQIVSAHYSYVSQKIRIPLAARVDGEHVTLDEPGGAVFDLHFITNSASHSRPISFWTATGLEGTWRIGGQHLPAKLGFVLDGTSVGGILDCELYPPSPKSKSTVDSTPHFPNPGCTHTPNRAVLDQCISRPFTTNEAVVQCVTASTHTCREDQMDMIFCIGNVSTYLDKTVRRRLHSGEADRALDAENYRAWTTSRTASCEKNSEFSPDGSGYDADITFCMAFEMMRLLQSHLVPTPEAFIAGPPSH
jgi:uncharacterized protein YecT (DUF1311 family)